ncbi:hypothetical protein MAM1_0207c07996 [Mucor ambiguus]|uniref:Uncharacterized protein n=1 Tax=Mucor ambiguus TaxID=91626 RepID=A0A0C9MLQ9_9FUNG|nr:hypothetical protein MAM1_0207c07996 [Mucor ambiguus]
MMHDISLFVDIFKTMEELSFEQPNGIENIQIIFRAESDTDIRRYNAPTVDEIGVLIVGDEAEGTGPHCINELHQHYDLLHYVLMFPTGELGWIYFRHLLTGHAIQHWHYRKRNKSPIISK